MASPQVENGFTKTANELLEAECLLWFDHKTRIYLAIKRLSYGWNQKDAIISYKKLSKMTNIDTHRLPKLVKQLEKMKIIFVDRQKSGNVFSINKDFDSWVTEKSSTIIGITEIGITQDGNTQTSNTQDSNEGITQKCNRGITQKCNRGITQKCNSNSPETPDFMLASESLNKELNKELKKVKEKSLLKEKTLQKKKLSANEKSDSEKESKVNGFACWIDANVALNRNIPIKLGRVTGTASRIAKGFKDKEELTSIMKDFLQDEDPFLVKNGHNITLLEGRIEKYRNISAEAAAENASTLEALRACGLPTTPEEHIELLKDPKYLASCKWEFSQLPADIKNQLIGKPGFEFAKELETEQAEEIVQTEKTIQPLVEIEAGSFAALALEKLTKGE